MSVNKCIFIGNLTRDPETRYMTSGEAVTNASIACNENYKDKDGNKKESVEFVNLVFYRRLAEIAGEYLKKGASIYIEGKMKTRKWQDKEGKDRYTTEIIVNEMHMLGGKSEQSEIKPKEVSPEKQEAPKNFDNFDDDIPFMRHGHSGAGVSWRNM